MAHILAFLRSLSDDVLKFLSIVLVEAIAIDDDEAGVQATEDVFNGGGDNRAS
jgi:hypothetical protein